MKTNLIENFVHNQNIQKPQASNQKKKEAPKFDIHHELANRTFIRPLKGQGRLINGSILDTPATMAQSLAYDFKALKDGSNGKANDHQLGKLNDIGMKIGGLSIAGYLFTKRQTPLTKALEFVGLGSFFGAMAIWPKIAIQLPAQLIHGFNVQQKYEDSFGRVKPFYQDPQFLPWDLYSDDEINKIGDRMNVPKDLPNRREFIQEKMKKIAIQNNTLWMLTAGFATPIMSALICNALEKPLAKPLSAMRNSSNNQMLANFNKIVKENNYNDINETIEKVVSINRNKPLTDTLLKELSDATTIGFPANVSETVARDLKQLLHTGNYIINNNSVNEISSGIKKSLKELGLDEEVVDFIARKPEDLTKYFENKGYYGVDYPEPEIDKIFNEYTIDLRKQISEFNKTHPENPISKDDTIDILRTLIKTSADENPIMKGLKKERGAVLNSANEEIIVSIAKAMNNLRGNLNVANDYLLKQLGTAPETTIADFWNNTVSKLVKNLKITNKEFADTRADRLLMQDLIMKRFDDVATDPKAYNALITSLIDQMSELTKLIKQSDVNETFLNSKEETKFNKQVDAIFKQFEAEMKGVKSLKDGDMEGLFSEMIGSRKNIEAPRYSEGSLKQLLKDTASNRLLEVKSSFFRILNSLDLHRRIAVGDPKYYTALHEKMPRETKEDVVELSKHISISGHTSDYLTKFFKPRNPRMETTDVSNIEIRNGRMVRKYTEANRKGTQVDMPQAKEMFVESMRLQYENPLLKETIEAFSPKHQELFNEFKQYRQKVLNEIGNAHAIEKELHKVSTNPSTASSALIFRITGAAPDEIFSKYGQQAFNTNKWLKMFGTAGAVLLGVTVLSQFFFGRMKLPQVQQPQEMKKG